MNRQITTWDPTLVFNGIFLFKFLERVSTMTRANFSHLLLCHRYLLHFVKNAFLKNL